MKLQGESGHLAKKQTRNIAEPFWSLCHGKKGGGFGRAAGEGKMLSVASAELDPPTGGIGGWGFFFFFSYLTLSTCRRCTVFFCQSVA